MQNVPGIHGYRTHINQQATETWLLGTKTVQFVLMIGTYPV